MIINPYLVAPSSAYDADAQAFFTAAGITDTTQKSAVNQLVLDLKSYSLWTKMKALYPFVGGTSTTHKYNLKDTTQYQITWYGGVTHDSNGITGNGTNSYGNTFLKSLTAGLSKDDCSLSVYSRSSIASGSSNPYDIGVGDNLGANLFDIAVRRNANQSIFDVGNYSSNRISQFISDGSGLFNGGANGSNLYYYRNGSLLGSSTQSSSNNILDKNVYVLGFNENDANTYYSDRNLAFASVGQYLNSTESANFYTAVQTFETTLGRQVGVPIVSDSDAQAFLNAAVITDTTQASAVNQLVTDLKGYGLWTKMKALYPFVGGTATTHSYNLKNTAQYQITFSGGWTHSSTGALPNGTNGYANTGLVPNTALTQNDSHVSIYNRNNTDGLYVDMGSRDGSAETLVLVRNSNSTLLSHNSNYGLRMTPSNSDSRGHFLVSRRGASEIESYRNGTSLSTATDASNRSTYSIYLSAWNDSGTANYFNNREIAFSSIGDGLTDTEASNFYTAVQAFQTTLSRNV